MPKYLSDTHSDAERVQIGILRRMSDERRFRILNDLILTGRALCMSSPQARFPNASPEVDFFVLRGSRYHQEEFRRRVLKQIDAVTNFPVYVQSPEDTLLSKLEWHRQGGEVSHTQ